MKKIFIRVLAIFVLIFALAGYFGSKGKAINDGKAENVAAPHEAAGNGELESSGNNENAIIIESVENTGIVVEDEGKDSSMKIQNEIIIESVTLDEWDELTTFIKNNSTETISIRETGIILKTFNEETIYPMDDRLAQVIEIPSKTSVGIGTLFENVDRGNVSEVLVYDINDNVLARLVLNSNELERVSQKDSDKNPKDDFEAVSLNTPASGLLSDIADQVENVVDQNNEFVIGIKASLIKENHSVTYGDAFGYFFGEPTWVYFEGGEGEKVVAFSGYCTVQESEVKANMQFVISPEGNSFEVGALDFNGVPQNQLVTGVLINTAFDEYISNN